MSETPTKYRVWMTIRGSISKPTYSGKVDVWADDSGEAFDTAIDQARRDAHWDSPRDAFRLDRVEVLSR